MTDIAQAIISYRGQNNLTQKEFAEKCNLTVHTVGDIERGKVNITAFTRAKILNLIGDLKK